MSNRIHLLTSSNTSPTIDQQQINFLLDTPLLYGQQLRDSLNITEERLRESQQRYVSLTNAAPVGIFRTDTVGNCLEVSDRWCEIAGMTVAEAMGEGWIKAIHPDDRDLVWVEWNQCVQHNLPFQLEYRFQRDGQMTWV